MGIRIAQQNIMLIDTYRHDPNIFLVDLCTFCHENVVKVIKIISQFERASLK